MVFPILHGPFGEDGTVQGLFELADLPYVGSGVLASALAMDKAMAKVVLAQAGLPQAPYLVVPERDWRADPDRVAAEVAGRLAYPVFTKPARLGSSIGISKVKTPDGLAAGLAAAFAHDTKALVEQGVAARELECGVLGNDAPEASVVGEVIPSHEFYDFEAKYLDDALKLEIPAQVPDDGQGPGPGAVAARLPGAGLRGLRPGRLLLRGGDRPGPAQRGQHHPRVHPQEHVPHALGRLRPGLPRPGRPPGRPGGRAPRRPQALSPGRTLSRDCAHGRRVPMFERFTDRARRVVVLAQEEARLLNHNYTSAPSTSCSA